MTYTITNSGITNYSAPSNVSYTAVAKNVRNVSRNYTILKERVYIKVTGTNATVTISYNGGVKWTQSCVAGTQYYHDVNYGTIYTVSFPFVNGYDCPGSVTYYADQNSRNVIGAYAEPNGAYIELTNGTFVKNNQFDKNTMTANSVVFINADHRIKIALTDAESGPWLDFHKAISGVTTVSSVSAALNDFNGKRNTDVLASQSYNTKAAKNARNYTFPNGQKGYLPAAGEFMLFINNYGSIGQCITKAGGTGLPKDDGVTTWDYWTSTQGDASSDAYAYSRFINNITINRKHYGAHVRPFGEFL